LGKAVVVSAWVADLILAVTFPPARCFLGDHSITTMKTLFALFYTFGVTAGAVSLDSYRLDPEVLFTAVAVAALFALALNDGYRPRRAVGTTRVTRFPTRSPVPLGRHSTSLDLAA
jgi:hypothetical protein